MTTCFWKANFIGWVKIKLGLKTRVACWPEGTRIATVQHCLTHYAWIFEESIGEARMDTEQWPWWIIVCWFCSWSWANPRQILIDLTTDLHSGRWLGRARVLGTEMESIWAAMLELLLIIHSVKYIISRPRDRLGPPALLPHAGHTTIADPQHRVLPDLESWTGLNWSSVSPIWSSVNNKKHI